MANVEAFKAFLKERQTGLQQRSEAWVKTRQHTIGASEISALTGFSLFETPASLVHKKLHPPDLSKNVACAWGKLFEPFVRAYLAWEHNTQVFGNTYHSTLPRTIPSMAKLPAVQTVTSKHSTGQSSCLSSSALSNARSQCTKPPLTTAIRYKPG